MALLGQGVVAIRGDLGTPERSAHDHWHSHEHLPERVGIAGFRRGRRAVSVDGGAPQILAIYEVDSLATLTSPGYLERLNEPTAWSAHVMGAMKQLTRTLCKVTASHGGGLGAHALTLALRPDPRRSEAFRHWLAKEVLPDLPTQAGITGAHLLERLRATLLSDRSLMVHGVVDAPLVGHWQLAHVMVPEDLPGR